MRQARLLLDSYPSLYLAYTCLESHLQESCPHQIYHPTLHRCRISLLFDTHNVGVHPIVSLVRNCYEQNNLFGFIHWVLVWLLNVQMSSLIILGALLYWSIWNFERPTSRLPRWASNSRFKEILHRCGLLAQPDGLSSTLLHHWREKGIANAVPYP